MSAVPSRPEPSERLVLVPGALALLPEYAGLDDPVAELRAACLGAVRWLGEDGVGFGVRGSHQGLRLAGHLAAATGTTLDPAPGPAARVLVVGNGTAMRTEKAPGHFAEDAEAFDDELRTLLTRTDPTGPAGLAGLDRPRAERLWADVDGLVWLGTEGLRPRHRVVVDYDAAPYGVQYWVMRWQCES